MWKDPIVEEVREARDRLAGRFGYDLGALVEYLRGKEREDSVELVRQGISGQRRSGGKAARGMPET